MILRKKTIVLIFSISIIATFSFLLISYLSNLKNSKEFNNILIKVDSLVLNGSFAKADEELIAAFSLANTPLEYKIILKRIKILKNYKSLYFFSEKAFKKFPKDEQILSIYIYSLLTINNFDKAQQVLVDLKTYNLHEYLKLESTIKAGDFSSEDNIFYNVLSEKNISMFIKLYQITTNNNFLNNAALLYLENGNFVEANDLLNNFEPDTFQSKKLEFLVKYGHHLFDDVLELLFLHDLGFTTEEMILIQIDIKLKMKQYKTASNEITDFIRLYPDYSVSPYINLIYLDSFIDIKNINKFIETAISKYPEDRNLNLILIEYYTLNDNEKNAIDLTEKYLEYNKFDKEFEIILKQLNGTTNPENFINNIYELVNQNKNISNSSIFLAWSLFKNKNIQDLAEYLEKEDNEMVFAWIYFFQALVYASMGEEDLSIEFFKSAYKLENNWESLYNLGLLHEYTKDYEKAIEYFQNSENMLTFVPENNELKSFIRTTLASLLYEIKDYNNAYREIHNALDLDSSNLKANLLLKKLESNNY